MSVEREAAIAYAARGWPIFPLYPIIGRRCDCRAGRDCKSIGKHPITTRWQNTIASATAAEAMWRDGLGTRGLGLVCGPRADLFGVDVDRRHGGADTVREWRRRGMRFPETVTDQTGDGWHLLYRWPQELDVEIRAQHLGAGVQCRGAGHFLVLPPSRHRSGCRYEWLRPPEDHELAWAPEWALELVVASSKRRDPIAGDDEQPLVPIGERYDKLVRFLGLLRSMGFGEAALVAFVAPFLDHAVEVDEARCPIDREHAYETARRIARSYPAERNRGPTDFATFRAPAPDGFHLTDHGSTGEAP